MGKRIILEEKTPVTPLRPSLNPDDREQQIANAAMNLAEQQILDGTASSQVITHFLKVASQRERMEIERLREENNLLKAKSEALKAAQDIKELYADAIKVFKGYQGIPDDEGETML